MARKNAGRNVRKEWQKISQNECQKICQKEGQKDCQKKCQTDCQKICQNICHREGYKICQERRPEDKPGRMSEYMSERMLERCGVQAPEDGHSHRNIGSAMGAVSKELQAPTRLQAPGTARQAPRRLEIDVAAATKVKSSLLPMQAVIRLAAAGPQPGEGDEI